MKKNNIDIEFDDVIRPDKQRELTKKEHDLVREYRRKLFDNRSAEESKVIALRSAIQEGLNSPRVENFDFDENLKRLKVEKRKNG